MKSRCDNFRPIQTHYNGYYFRSRAEARWAVFFDTCGIKYLYEPEGFRLSDGTLYLPDFYLPDCDMWFEVKGVMSEKDLHKIEQLMIDSRKAVIVGYPEMTFEACNNWGEGSYTRAEMDMSSLCRCKQCGCLWFVGYEGSYTCANCGYYTGDDHFDVLLEGLDADDFLRSIPIRCNMGKSKFKNVAYFAAYKARQARFEFGEAVNSG